MAEIALVGAATAQPVPHPAIRGGSGEFTTAVVAADHEVASRAGAEMLARGGNAVDAAVAASFALSVVRPYSCGIGGGGFMVIVLPDDPDHGKVAAAINYRETAPSAITPDYYEKHADASARTWGGTAVATPGTVAGLLHALERHGRLDRRTVLAPAIRAARDGFTVDADHAKVAADMLGDFAAIPERRERFAFTFDRLMLRGAARRGDVIRNPEQSAALELIAERGAAAFYDGPIAQALLRAVRADGGVLSGGDLADYRVADVEPLRFDALGRTFYTMPPPSSGGVCMAQTLGILARTGYADHAGQRQWGPCAHFLAESFKHAFADRSRWMGDPAFVEVPLARLLSPDYLAERAATIRLHATMPADAYGSAPPLPDDGGTSHISAVDPWGGAVACTETINLEFGSRLAVPEFGFCLNNQMDDFLTRRGEKNAFGLEQSERNLPAPGKRPLSSMSPTVVVDAQGRVEAVAGASGGPRIITATTQVLLNSLVLGMVAPAAVAAPRLHHQWQPNELRFERDDHAEWNGEEVHAHLQRWGHDVRRTTSGASVQFIRRIEGGWHAASDGRKGGVPAGW